MKQDEEKLNVLSHMKNMVNIVNYLVHGKL